MTFVRNRFICLPFHAHAIDVSMQHYQHYKLLESQPFDRLIFVGASQKKTVKHTFISFSFIVY